MVFLSDLESDVDSRRAELLAQRADGTDITGIDYIVVNPGQESLEVFFIDSEPPAELVTGGPGLFEITGGRRVSVRVVDVSTTPGSPSSLHLELSGYGDFSDYVLEITQPSGGDTTLDEHYRRCEFNFKVDCPARFDCRPPTTEIAPSLEGIEVDYLAKDYASFRQALVDLIPRLSPQWTERLAADLGITVLELLAYAADRLSYYQDAVANEAYLETARQRVSVRRHARLVDYEMHDGASARAFIQLELHDGLNLTLNEDDSFELLTRIDAPIHGAKPGAVIAADDREEAVRLAGAVFATFTPTRLDSRLNRIELHDWGDASCWLPAGAKSADLVGSLDGVLSTGDLLLFEEIKKPSSGDATLFDPAHRQVVRLTKVEYVLDNLTNTDVTRVTWDAADALTFTLWVTSEGGGTGISVARGNLVLADHGMTVTESGREADPIASGDGVPRFTLERGPLSFRPALPADGEPAALLAIVDPHGAAPEVTVEIDGVEWTPVTTLIGSDRFDARFAVETGDDGKALLRFGDDQFGMDPGDDATFDVSYRIGLGPEGNVGSESIAHIIEPDAMGVLGAVIARVRNPLPAWGGLDPESTEAVKRAAPAAFRAIQHRAVTEADYAEVATRHASVRSAVARFRWTGSWHTVFISIDPEGRLDLDDDHRELIAAHVEQFTQAGYDLEIVPPHYVPLAIDLEICAGRAHFRADVEQAVRAALTSGLQANGLPGFFHPDNFSFGESLYLSALYTAVADVEGVDSVVATRFARLSDNEPESGGAVTAANIARGEIVIGPPEIVRLDDDADFPENGLLRLSMQGGK